MLLLSIKHLLLFSLRSILIILLIPAVLVCILSCQKEEKVVGPPEKITIASSTASKAFLFYISFPRGYLADEGLDATPQPHTFGKLALDTVLEGKADLATVADTPIVFAVMNAKRITTIAVVQTSNRDEAIVARLDSSIEKPSDLKGKKIGATLETTSDVEKIFGLFEKLDPETEGAGLGMAFVKGIVAVYHGNIWVESDGLGKGSCFRLTLPDAVIKQSPGEKT